MQTVVPVKLLALGTLLMAVIFFTAACGGGGDDGGFTRVEQTQLVETSTSIPANEPTITATTKAEEPTATTVAPTPGDGPIELRLMIMKRSPNNTVTVLKEGDEMTADDFYGIFFETPVDAWVYVLQQDSTGAISVLFPNPAYSEQVNPLSGGTPVWIPKDYNNWFFLDQNVGRESFFVIASKEQNKDLEIMLAGDLRGEVLGPLGKLLDDGGRGLGGVEKLAEAPKLLPDGTSAVLEEQILKGDGDNFVYTLEFDHK